MQHHLRKGACQKEFVEDIVAEVDIFPEVALDIARKQGNPGANMFSTSTSLQGDAKNFATNGL